MAFSCLLRIAFRAKWLTIMLDKLHVYKECEQYELPRRMKGHRQERDSKQRQKLTSKDFATTSASKAIFVVVDAHDFNIFIKDNLPAATAGR